MQPRLFINTYPQLLKRENRSLSTGSALSKNQSTYTCRKWQSGRPQRSKQECSMPRPALNSRAPQAEFPQSVQKSIYL